MGFKLYNISMYKTKTIKLIKEIFYIILISLIGCAGIVFSVLYIDAFSNGFWFEYSSVITAITVSIITVLTVLSIMFFSRSKEMVYKLCFLSVLFLSLITLTLYLIKITGLLDKVDSIEDFRQYVAGFGAYAVFLFVLIQFLQVVVLPIPSFVTVGAGVLLFGPFLGSIYSCIGIISGSIVAFLVGRIFGVKVVKWLIGQQMLDKWLAKIKGKDKIVLTFMFLFPFFPDDVLCFVSGITSMSTAFFVIMIVAVRLITVFVSSYSMNNSIIPYNTWWGILLWLIFFVVTILLALFVYKNGEKIENKFKTKIKKNK